MKSRNVIVSLILVLFVAAAAGGWWLYLSIDARVKRAIEHWGPRITGVTVKAEGVRIRMAEGGATIRGLAVGNPPGFAAAHALRLGEMRLTIDPASLAKDVVVIREMLFVAPDLYFERGQGSDNLTLIQNNVDAWVARNAGAAKKEDGPGRKFLIEKIVIKDGKAHFSATLSAPMREIQLADIGAKTNGASAGEAANKVWRALLGSALTLALRMGGAIR